MEQNKQENMLSALDQLMRALRRRPHDKQHFGRGVYRILSLVQAHPGISTRELAEKLDMRASSLNEKLIHLEQEQFLKRSRDRADQRVFVIELLEKGCDHLKEIAREREQTHSDIPQILSEEEIDKLTKLLSKLAIGLQKRERS